MKNNKKLNLPLHIRSSLISIKSLKNSLDLLVSVSDSRLPISTNLSSELSNLFPKIKILNLFSKSDLSKKNLKNSFNFKIQNNRKKIINLIREALKEKMEYFNKESYFRDFQILVVGVPNVGKSTLINLLKNKKVSLAQNKPGLTRKITKHLIDENIWIYDSPGILSYKHMNSELSEKLFLINSIPTHVKHYSHILEKVYKYLFHNNSVFLEGLVKDFIDDNYHNFLKKLAYRYNFKSKNEDDDLIRSESKFLELLRTSKICWDEVKI